MAGTAFDTRPEVFALNARHRRVHNHSAQRSGGGRVDTFGHPMFIGLPDGGGPYTTASDLASFGRALQVGKLLPPRSRRFLSTASSRSPHQSAPALDARLGSADTDSRTRSSMTATSSDTPGDGPGIATNLDIYPELDWIAVYLSNYDLVPFGTTAEDAAIVNLERRLITEIPTPPSVAHGG
jgi:hypothetical protein